jgi:hypothetical protein
VDSVRDIKMPAARPCPPCCGGLLIVALFRRDKKPVALLVDSTQLDELEPQLTGNAVSCTAWLSSSTPTQRRSADRCWRKQEHIDELRAGALPT